MGFNDDASTLFLQKACCSPPLQHLDGEICSTAKSGRAQGGSQQPQPIHDRGTFWAKKTTVEVTACWVWVFLICFLIYVSAWKSIIRAAGLHCNNSAIELNEQERAWPRVGKLKSTLIGAAPGPGTRIPPLQQRPILPVGMDLCGAWSEPPPGTYHLLNRGRCPGGGDMSPRTVLAQHLVLSVCKHWQPQTLPMQPR